MRALAAVEPQGLGVVDENGVDGHLAEVAALLSRHEAGLDSSDGGAVGGLGDGHAGLVKVGLGDGVVAGPELELDHAAGGGCDLLGPVLVGGDVVDRVVADVDDLNVNGYVECQLLTLQGMCVSRSTYPWRRPPWRP